MQDHFRVRSRVEDGTVLFKFGSQGVVINEVAVVRYGDGAEPVSGEEGLYVVDVGLAGGRVADVADGGGAGELGEFGLVNDVGDEADAGD